MCLRHKSKISQIQTANCNLWSVLAFMEYIYFAQFTSYLGMQNYENQQNKGIIPLSFTDWKYMLLFSSQKWHCRWLLAERDKYEPRTKNSTHMENVCVSFIQLTFIEPVLLFKGTDDGNAVGKRLSGWTR